MSAASICCRAPGSAAVVGALNLVGGTVVAGTAATAGTPGTPGTADSYGAQPASHVLQFQLGPDADQIVGIDIPTLDAGRLGLSGLDLADPNALQQIDAALATLLEVAGRAGAFQTRLQIAASFSLEQAALLDQASDRIVGADMAIEHTEFVRNSVRLQAATAMAGQARSLDLQQVSRLLTR